MVVSVLGFSFGGITSEWHAEEIQRLGLTLIRRERVDTPGMRNGANAELRVDGEDVWVFRK